MKNLWNKFKATKGYRVVKIIMDSASFALFLSVAFLLMKCQKVSEKRKRLSTTLWKFKTHYQQDTWVCSLNTSVVSTPFGRST